MFRETRAFVKWITTMALPPVLSTSMLHRHHGATPIIMHCHLLSAEMMSPPRSPGCWHTYVLMRTHTHPHLGAGRVFHSTRASVSRLCGSQQQPPFSWMSLCSSSACIATESPPQAGGWRTIQGWGGSTGKPLMTNACRHSHVHSRHFECLGSAPNSFC